MLTLYKHSLLFWFEFNEQILKTVGNILIINGNTKEIAKLTKTFLKINIWVFGYTAPKEERSIQKNPRNINPKMKKIVYLITKFFLSFSETE